MKLYEINDALEAALNQVIVDEETGEIISAPDMEQVAALQLQKEEKIENVVLYVKNAESDAAQIAEEIKRLQERKRILENRIESARGWVQQALEGEKFQTPRCQVSYRTTKSVAIDDMSAIPAEYLRVKTDADKALIRKAIAAGETVSGAHIETSTSMSIK